MILIVTFLLTFVVSPVSANFYKEITESVVESCGDYLADLPDPKFFRPYSIHPLSQIKPGDSLQAYLISFSARSPEFFRMLRSISNEEHVKLFENIGKRNLTRLNVNHGRFVLFGLEVDIRHVMERMSDLFQDRFHAFHVEQLTSQNFFKERHDDPYQANGADVSKTDKKDFAQLVVNLTTDIPGRGRAPNVIGLGIGKMSFYVVKKSVYRKQRELSCLFSSVVQGMDCLPEIQVASSSIETQIARLLPDSNDTTDPLSDFILLSEQDAEKFMKVHRVTYPFPFVLRKAWEIQRLEKL
ncbi:MAG: hypothetical protein AB7F43_14730 [Bacteriovoracia bacterium]